MKSYRIGWIAGIEVKLHATFPLFILILGLLEGKTAGILAGLQLIGVLVALFAFVLLHELGHSLVAQRFGVRVISITLLPIGGLAATGSLPRHPSQEILIALAGPAVNIVIAAILGTGLYLAGTPFDLQGSGAGPFFSYLFSANIMLALFNLLPAFPLDGGRVLRALMVNRLPYLIATRRAVLVGNVIAVLFFVLGLWQPTFIMLSFIAAFIFFSGRRELRNVELEEFLHESRARELLDKRPWFYAGRDTRCAEIFAALSSESDLAYSVVDLEGLRYGILTRQELLSACLALPAHMKIHRLVKDTTPALQGRANLYQAIGALRRAPHGILPVRDGGDIVGILALEDVEQALAQIRESQARF
jgi:Zn-dependent protease